MSPTRPKIPADSIELYNKYVHGEIDRRDYLSGIKRFAIGGLTAGAIVDALMPKYAEAQQVSKTDELIKSQYVTIPSPQGNGSIKAYLVRPFRAETRAEKPIKLQGELVVQEHRGLHTHLEDIARRVAPHHI